MSMKLELQRLMKAEQDAKRKESSFVSDASNVPAPVSPRRSQRALARSMPTHEESRAINPSPTPFINFRAQESSKPDYGQERFGHDNLGRPVESKDVILDQLNECAKAIADLASSVEEVTIRWLHSRQYELRYLERKYDKVSSAMSELHRHERPSRGSPGSYFGDGDYRYNRQYDQGRQGHSLNEIDGRRRRGIRNPNVEVGGLYRTQSQGDGPVPMVNVYYDVIQDAKPRTSSPVSPHSPSPEPLGDDVVESLVDLALENRRLRSRSRSRSDADDETDILRDESLRREEELQQLEREILLERGKERIQAEYELTKHRNEIERRSDSSADARTGAKKKVIGQSLDI